MSDLSPRLRAIVDALPLRPGLRVIEIGCGPGAAAREVATRVGPEGHVLAVDRSARALATFVATSQALIAAGRLTLRQVAAEDLELAPDEAPCDLAFAVRVGALDGRHPRRVHSPSSVCGARSSRAGACSSTAVTRFGSCRSLRAGRPAASASQGGRDAT